ncbi:MAG TPA: GNAT family N-acetyltransferase [Candidatus Nanopelagicales bacterium]|nr:GNAT family N-acetyltransferase [Candidatus Nanopelagicales bacterium]
MTLLETERLVLRTLTADEAAAIRSGDRTGRAWADDYPSDGDAVVAAVIGEAGEHYDESAPLGVLQVLRRDTGLAVGGIGFLHAVEDGEAEVGYGLAESAHGQGYATEALVAVLGLAREHGVERVVALTDLDNLASQRVLQRCRFEPAGSVSSPEGEQLRWLRRLD